MVPVDDTEDKENSVYFNNRSQGNRKNKEGECCRVSVTKRTSYAMNDETSKTSVRVTARRLQASVLSLQTSLPLTC